MTKLLADKLVVVTGGAGLLGYEFCMAIAQNGGTVVLADLNFEAAQKKADIICGQYPGQAIAAAIDITKQASIGNVLDQLKTKWGKIDAVVNNAYPRNASYGRRLEEVTYEDFCENVSMHLGGYFLVAQQFAEHFSKQGYGNIINISSIYGVMVPRFEMYEGTEMTMPVEYAAIKSGVLQLSKYFAKYFKGTGIRVNSISPGGIKDKQPKLFLENYKGFCANKGMLDKSDLVGALIFLLSEMSTFMTGQNLIIDDGFSL